MNTNITNKKEHQQGMLEGIKSALNLIRTTYGPKGENISVEIELYPGHIVANDAQTIIQAIKVDGVPQKRGLNFLRELMDKINNLSADGRKTTAILLEEIFEQGINSGMSGNELKEELDKLIPLIENKIDENKTTITEEEVYKVATIASESKELGGHIGEIYKRIGKDGIIIPEGSGTYQTDYSFIEGVRFQDAGFLSPFMVHDTEAVKHNQSETKAVYENPTILVTRKKISHLNDINPLLKKLEEQNKKDLVIFTDDMDSNVASIMVKAHRSNAINILIIRAPVLWKNYIFDDFAKVTGSTIIEDSSGLSLGNNIPLNALGTCGKITVDKDETTIVGIADISEHIKSLQKDGSDDSKLRLSWLVTKTAILKLGANNESELSHKRLKCYDAINSSRLALKDGVVRGGGLALKNASEALPDTVAGNILRKALQEPYKVIESSFKNYVIGEEVVDSALVIKNAVRNSIAMASTMLTLGGDVAIPPKTPEEIALLAKQQMKF